jgi:hypothetical protein
MIPAGGLTGGTANHVALDGRDIEIANSYAIRDERGGVSRLRGEEDRGRMLFEDQKTGQYGALAAHYYLLDRERGLQLYRDAQERTQRHRYDFGCDVGQFAIDCKSTCRRVSDRPFHQFRLAVRPAERHGGDHRYVLPMVERGPWIERVDVFLLGWCFDRELIHQATEGVYGPLGPDKPGAYYLMAPDLHPMRELRTWVRANLR